MRKKLHRIVALLASLLTNRVVLSVAAHVLPRGDLLAMLPSLGMLLQMLTWRLDPTTHPRARRTRREQR